LHQVFRMRLRGSKFNRRLRGKVEKRSKRPTPNVQRPMPDRLGVASDRRINTLKDGRSLVRFVFDA
jgi:hypothetical protein